MVYKQFMRVVVELGCVCCVVFVCGHTVIKQMTNAPVVSNRFRSYCFGCGIRMEIDCDMQLCVRFVLNRWISAVADN